MNPVATRLGEVRSVSGSTVSIRIDLRTPSLALVHGESYRVGQVGSFVRIPLGYTQLYGICTEVGASPLADASIVEGELGGRWMTVALFGESLGGEFRRGVGQHPTFGDVVHLVTDDEVDAIYGRQSFGTPLDFGQIATTSGTRALLDLGRLVSRHSAIVGSSGSGKSNLVAVLLEAITSQGYESARVLVIDPHGEYGEAMAGIGRVFNADPAGDERPLQVPYWALPVDELLEATLGEMSSSNVAAVRAEIEALKKAALGGVAGNLAPESITADSPIPFSLRQLWSILRDFEDRTYVDNGLTTPTVVTPGDPNALTPNQYPPPALGSGTPYKGPRRGLTRNLELLRNRLLDARYDFLFQPGPYTPDLAGAVTSDLDALVAEWVGHSDPITVMDLSATPADVLSLVTGTLLRVIFDTLYWAGDSPASGQRQPLLIVLEEAHLFLPDGEQSAAQRVVSKIAREGRKYGVGLMLVTQRPVQLDSTALSQCGTMFALRLTNSADRGRVSSAVPDELSSLTALLPSLRTGEVIVAGEAVPLPSRVRVSRSRRKVAGNDPDLLRGWRTDPRPHETEYASAVRNWRALTTRPVDP